MKETNGTIFDYLLPILGLVFLGGKILTKRPEQKITASSSKKVVHKNQNGDIKKKQLDYLKRTRTEGY